VESLLPEAPTPALADSLQQYVAAQTPSAFRQETQEQPQIGDGFLTPREQEVARLVAQGATNREIAAQLVISERTAETHVGNILNKLDFTSRAQIAAWVVEQKQDIKG
jgi:DNA-binding NarL/FixJ family response regulator